MPLIVGNDFMRNEERSAPVVEGEVLAGKYRVERVLGAGGMGVVVAARHLQLDQLVALKFVLPSAASDASATERFLREAKLAVRLKSEHVAKVLDVGTLETGAPYMVMEYLEGQNLAEYVQRHGLLPVEMAADFLVQVCEALSEAHALGIVHRDLKPQNLFLTKGVGGAPLVKVLDFGISKMAQAPGAQNLTQTTTVMGSPLYMAPEQMRSSREVDQRADIWALGIVLYELLSARLPFEADSMTELALKIVQDAFVPIHQLRPEVPPEMSTVIGRCLEKDRVNRFDDAGQLASALGPFAPASSQMSIHRARLVISGLQQTLEAKPGSRPDLPPMAGTPPTKQSPGPWSGSGANTKHPEAAKHVTVALALFAILVGTIGVVAYRALSNARSSAPASSAVEPGTTPVASSKEAASAAPLPPSPLPPSPLPPSPLPPSTGVAVTPDSSASGAPTAPPPGASSAGGRPSNAGRGGRAAQPKPAPSHPSNRDDDIPSLR